MRNIALLMTLVVLISGSSFAAENKNSDAQAVNAACAADAATAGCTSQKVGTGLLKCLHFYKKDHREHKFAKSCIKAMNKMRVNRRARQ